MRSTIALALLAGVATAPLGCSAETGPSEQIGETQAAVVGVDTFLYIRSNASGWGADANTRLLPFVGAGLFARAIEVDEPWMVSSGDNAIVTETNQQDGWGSVQTDYRATSGTLVEPATDTLTASSSNFTIRYQALGPHRVVVNVDTTPWEITVQPVTCPNCPAPTQCVINPNSVPTCSL